MDNVMASGILPMNREAVEVSGVEAGFRELDIQLARYTSLVDTLEKRLQRALTEGANMKSPESPVDVGGSSGLAYTIMTNADVMRRSNNILESLIHRIDL